MPDGIDAVSPKYNGRTIWRIYTPIRVSKLVAEYTPMYSTAFDFFQIS